MRSSSRQGRRSEVHAARPRRSALGAGCRRLLLAAALGVAWAPPLALAQSGDAAASRQFAQARKLYSAGDCKAALPLFQEAVQASGSPNARLYVALCLRDLGRLPEAYEEMSITLRDATARADTEPKYAQARDTAAAERAILETRVGRLIVAVANAEPGMEVTIDGKPVPANRIGRPIAVEPGMRQVTVTAPDGAKIERDVNVPAGEMQTLALTLPEATIETSPPPTPSPPAEEPAESGGTVRTVGYAVAGLGVAGIGLFAITGLMANSKFSTLETECGPGPCTDPKYADVIDSGKTLDTLANVGLIVGLAGLGAGTAMILFGGPSSTTEPSTTAAITAWPGGAALRFHGTF